MNNLDYPLQLRSVQALNSFAQILLLIKSEEIIFSDACFLSGFLAVLLGREGLGLAGFGRRGMRRFLFLRLLLVLIRFEVLECCQIIIHCSHLVLERGDGA